MIADSLFKKRFKHSRFLICFNSENKKAMDKVAMQIQLVKIEELLYDDKTKPDDDIQETIFVKLLLNVLPDIRKNLMELVVGVIYHTESENLLTYEVKSVFKIKGMNEFVYVQNQNVFVMPQLLNILIGISIGSLRGMLVLKTSESAFKNYPLPIMNIAELVASLQTETVRQYPYSSFLGFKYEW